MTDTEDRAGLEARITDEDVERARAQIGIPVPNKDTPFVQVPDASSISHFAFGYGDDNPLFHDRGYSAGTRWGDVVAPPLYPIATGVDLAPSIPAEQEPLFRGLFRGVGKYYSGVEWEWYRPILPGDVVYCETATSAVTEKQSSFSGGRSVIETYQTLYVNRVGEPIAVRRESYVSAERSGSKKAGKHASIERQVWTDELLAEVEACYADEARQGAEILTIEQVNVGEPLQRIAKGPLTTTDIISMHMGMGWGGYGQGPLRLAYEHRRKMRAFYTPDEFGVPQVVQRLHWDQQRALDLGLPAPYDYGQMRSCWLTQAVTNWMGDDAWLWRFGCQTRGFNFHGDVQWCTGEVTATREEGPHHVADVDLAATNQRGELTAPGTATVILPSKGRPLVLPQPPDDLRELGARMVTDRAARLRQP